MLVRPSGVDPTVRELHIAATKRGFEPSRLEVRRGETATLVFTRTVERTCAKDVVLYLSEDSKVRRELPLSQPVAITLTFTRVGELGFACGMSMLGGAIHVR